MIDLRDKLIILFYILSNAFEDWQKEVWKKDLDERFCCDGRECGCGGATFRDMYAYQPKSKTND